MVDRDLMLGPGVIADVSVKNWSRLALFRHLFIAALVVSAILLVPDVSQAEFISGREPLLEESGGLNFGCLAGLNNDLTSGGSRSESSDPASQDETSQEKSPFEDEHRKPQDGDLLAATPGGRGATGNPPPGETDSGSSVIACGGPRLPQLRVVGRVSMGPEILPISPSPDGLLDPPKISV
jgi:hypothetical protein